MPIRGVPAGLYLHIPFCSAVCPYCDFAVQTATRESHAPFVDTLIAEIALNRDWPVAFDTIYFGGGTPSLLSANCLSRLLDAIRSHLPLHSKIRLFMEANPEDVTRDRAQAWRSLGVNTLSLGVQSFVAEELRTLGRRHGPDDAKTAVLDCLDAGFDTVSVDLMFGLPAQSRENLHASLSTTLELSPQHVSCYQLTIHEGTTFGRWQAKGKLVPLAEDPQATLFDLVHTCLGDGGFTAYEVSNFAKTPAHRSQHNMKYWRHAPYLGLGPSAHSFDGHHRWWNARSLAQYTEMVAAGSQPIAERETLTASELALETVMLGLRTLYGISLKDFEARFNFDLAEQNAAMLDDLRERGLLEINDGRLVPTRRGLAVVDGLAARFVLP